MKTYYKIVEKHQDGLRTLFHGNKGSRILKTNIWLEANIKMVIDGSDGKKYLSGWHVLKSENATEIFLQKMFRVKKDRRIIPILVRGVLRPKSHSRHEVYLADEMFIIE